MKTVEYPALAGEDQSLVERFAVGLDNDTARVLTYLRLRLDRFGSAEPATRLAIRIGTGLSRGAISDALDTLESLGLVSSTSVQRHESGRPPQAWTTEATATPGRVYELHADRLLTRAGANTPLESSKGSKEETKEPLSIGLNWHPNALHAPLYVGEANGYYENEGLDVRFTSNTGSAPALDAVATGEVDVALVGAATFVASERDDLVPLALLYERAMAVLYTTREAFGGPFERVQQLRGRHIGMSTGAETARLARLLLAQVDTLSAVNIVDIEGEERAALQSGQVDAVTGQVADPEQLAGPKSTVDSLSVAKQFPLYGPALVTTDAVLDTRIDAIRSFLVGTMCGWADTAENADEAVECLPDSIARSSSDQATVETALAEYGFEPEHGWGWHTEAGWERLQTALAQVESGT